MRMVLNDPIPAEVADLLARRRALGQDTFDEVWNGEYHMNPSPNMRHARVQLLLGAFLLERSEAAGLFAATEANIGTSGNYRVPDLVVVAAPSARVWEPTALIVVEVLSPGDESLQKFEHYGDHDVAEVWIVDPDSGRVEMHVQMSGGYRLVGRSAVLDVDAATVTARLSSPG